MRTFSLIGFLAGLIPFSSFSQSCIDTWPGRTQNLSTLAGWSCSGGGTSPTSAGTYTENLTISTMGNNDVLITNFTFTLIGNWTVNSNAHATITVPSGVTVTINGNFTDANNNVTFNVLAGGHLIINGTLTSNNNTVFSGGGTITATTLSLGTASCGSPCPTITATNCSTTSGNFCSTTVLPITLLSFNAKTNDKDISLSWSTASELNFDHFDLQKSDDGSNFKSIGQVKGHGTTNERHDYSFDDNFPLIGKNYYRLTSIDFDNYRETFKVIVQDYSGEKDFLISPNPSDGKALALNFNFDSTEGTVVIYDNIGSIVESFQVNEMGEVTFSNVLKNGIYFAKYSSPSFTKAIRFLVSQ